MLPFLVDMERLYELFVAEWLKYHVAFLRDLLEMEKKPGFCYNEP